MLSSVSAPGCATRCASRPGVERVARLGRDDVGGRRERRRLRRQRPAAVLLDPDRDRLVAVRVEVLEDRRRRGERHLVLARPAAVDDADAEFFHDGLFTHREDAEDTEVRSVGP